MLIEYDKKRILEEQEASERKAEFYKSHPELQKLDEN